MNRDHPIKIPGYSIHKPLGRGGMATVYLATQESLHRKVAIKVLLDSRGDKATERFMKEAHFIASLNHPKIITIHDISTLDNGDFYIAMEYLDGGDLRQQLASIITTEQALLIIKGIAEGLTIVHKKGIVHRDIKPANILFRGENDPVLTDFGIAKDIECDSDMTQAGFSLGSPSYMSPEQAQNKPLDHRSDIYSLGVTFLEMVLGYNAFKGGNDTQTAINQIQKPLSEMINGLEVYARLTSKMLAKSPEDRFKDCEELIASIDEVMEMQSEDAPTNLISVGGTQKLEPLSDGTIYRSSSSAVKTQNNKPKLFAIVVASFVGLAALVAIYYFTLYETKEQKLIRQYLAEAELRLNEQKLIEPDNNNARYFYQQVLFLDQDNETALEGLVAVKKRQIKRYTNLGMESLEKGYMGSPADNNAIHYFKKALALDANSKEAHEGLQQVANEYLRLANEAFVRKQYRRGHRYLTKGLRVKPKDEALISLQEKYKNKKNPIRNILDNVFR